MRRRWIKTAVLALLLAPFLANGTAVLPGTGSYVVASGSIGETAPVGSTVVVSEADASEPGDVITFRAGDGTVTHRAVEETRAGFVTRGDANGTTDERRVTRSQVVETVVFVRPAFGVVVLLAGSWLGSLAVVLVPGVAVLVLELRLREESGNTNGR